MALSDLLQKIETDGKAQVAGVLADAEKRAESIRATYKDKQEALRAQFAQETETLLLKQAKNSEERDARTQKHIMTDAKRTVIHDVFADALSALLNLDEKAYVAFIEKQLTAIQSDLTDVVIRTPEARVSATKIALKNIGAKASCEADDTIAGGFIVSGKDYEYDFTFARLLETHKDDLESEVVQTLFN